MQHLNIHLKKLSTLLISAVAVFSFSFSSQAAQLITEDKNTAIQTSKIDTQNCPNAFYQVTLPKNGKLCQVFAAELPASMIFFVPQSPNEVVEYYHQSGNMFSTVKHVKNRYMLQSNDKNTTIIISSDGKGTQVDVLVKNDTI